MKLSYLFGFSVCALMLFFGTSAFAQSAGKVAPATPDEEKLEFYNSQMSDEERAAREDIPPAMTLSDLSSTSKDENSSIQTVEEEMEMYLQENEMEMIEGFEPTGNIQIDMENYLTIKHNVPVNVEETAPVEEEGSDE